MFFLFLFVISIHLMYYSTVINSTLLVYKIKRAHWVLVRCLQHGRSVVLQRGCSGHWHDGGDGGWYWHGGGCSSVACDVASGGAGRMAGACTYTARKTSVCMLVLHSASARADPDHQNPSQTMIQALHVLVSWPD